MIQPLGTCPITRTPMLLGENALMLIISNQHSHQPTTLSIFEDLITLPARSIEHHTFLHRTIEYAGTGKLIKEGWVDHYLKRERLRDRDFKHRKVVMHLHAAETLAGMPFPPTDPYCFLMELFQNLHLCRIELFENQTDRHRTFTEENLTALKRHAQAQNHHIQQLEHHLKNQQNHLHHQQNHHRQHAPQ